MKVFISWSGNVSYKVASAFNEWLPLVSQSIEPFFSADNIDKGTRWSQEISRELETTAVGLFCVTPENLDSSWLNYEAGAISKALGGTANNPRVMPFLFGLKKSDVQWPLAEFQMTINEKNDIRKLLESINRASGVEELAEPRLLKSFEKWWPELESALKELPHSVAIDKNVAIDDGDSASRFGHILEELLELARDQSRVLNSADFQSAMVRQRPPVAAVPRSVVAGLANSWDHFTDQIHALNTTGFELPASFASSITDLSDSIDSLMVPLNIEAYSPEQRELHLNVIGTLLANSLADKPGSIEEVPWDDGEPPF